MSAAQQVRRRQQYLEELSAASLGALSGQAGWAYRGRRLSRHAQALPLRTPHLRLEEDDCTLDNYRAVSDAIALRLIHTDEALHLAARPALPETRLIYDLLEQLRVEALVDPDMPGVKENLARRFTDWCLAFYHAGLTETSSGILIYSVIQSCWSRLMACAVIHETEDYIETTRASFYQALGADMAGLRRTRFDQAAYQQHALNISLWLEQELAESLEEQDGEEDDESEASQRFALFLENEDEEASLLEEQAASQLPSHRRGAPEELLPYQVFTTAYDRELEPARRMRAALLDEYRQALDTRLAEQKINVRRLARQLARHFSSPQREGWHFGEEEGIIDGRRLSQVISSPAERRVFQRERWVPEASAQVSFLIDCSGSMKVHGEAVAMLIEILTRALDMAGVPTEVLGFTTGAWNGGRALKDWRRAGKPARPGRLNEVQYLIFKPASLAWRRARRNFGALLKADLYREGVDGEAVQWACSRLADNTTADEGARRLLIVISDGSPCDSATNMANDEQYLDSHLKQVVAQQTRSGRQAILGLGVGLDLSAYYPNQLIIDLERTLDNALADEIVYHMALACRHQARNKTSK
ncbi:cobalamin biosynthesis protein CobT [Cobetia sp. SIMBA_158]|uniref:cobaltochelatase CobT-related protein n=1 Tax=Cobetia sp. SIMBA_158 TaxID=3081617 RepID=UPI00397E9966